MIVISVQISISAIAFHSLFFFFFSCVARGVHVALMQSYKILQFVLGVKDF